MARAKTAKKKLSPAEQREAQKQAKQKKILLILAPVLLIAVAIQIPKLLGGDEEPAATDTTAVEEDGAEAPAPAAGAAPDPSPTASPADGTDPVLGDPLLGGPGVPSSVARLAEVSDSDPLAPVGVSELISFTTFIGDDPFVQLVEPPPPAEESGGGGAGGGGGSGSGSGGASGDPAATESLAILEINGAQEVVQVGGHFPADDPAFRLVAIDGTAAITFGLVEGSFSSGIETLDVETGRSITLVSQPDGFRYTIRLVQITTDAGAIQGLPAPAPPPPAG